MEFEVGDKVTWQPNPGGGLPPLADEFGQGPFKVKSIRGVSVCDCGRAEEFADSFEEYDDINLHSLDCALWHSGDENYFQNYQLLTVETNQGSKEIGECWFQKAA